MVQKSTPQMYLVTVTLNNQYLPMHKGSPWIYTDKNNNNTRLS